MPRLIPPEIRALQEQLAGARLDALTMRNGVMSGELVNRREVEHQVGDMIMRVRMLMLALPGRLSGQIADMIGAEQAAVHRIMRQVVIETLNELSAGEAAAAERARARFGTAPEPVAPRKKRRVHRSKGVGRGRKPGDIKII